MNMNLFIIISFSYLIKIIHVHCWLGDDACNIEALPYVPFGGIGRQGSGTDGWAAGHPAVTMTRLMTVI